MGNFKIHSKFKPMGDQPVAIESLVSRLNKNEKFQTLLGVTGSGKTYTMAKIANSYIAHGKSVLIVSHSNVSVDGVIKQVVKMLGTDKQSVLEDGKILLRHSFSSEKPVITAPGR